MTKPHNTLDRATMLREYRGYRKMAQKASRAKETCNAREYARMAENALRIAQSMPAAYIGEDC